MAPSVSKPVLLIASLMALWIPVFWLWSPAATVREEPDAKITRGSAPAAAVESVPSGEDELPQPTEPAYAPASGFAPAPLQGAHAGTAIVQRLIPPEFSEYTVQKGDRGFADVSRRVYGTGRHADAISRANPYVSPDKLKPGKTVLKIPADPSNIQGKIVSVPVPTAPAPAPLPTAKPVPAPAPDAAPSAQGEQRYTIKSTDTLSGISKKFYGKSSLWRKVYNANRSVIDDPDHLKSGAEIVIPPKD